MDFNTTHFLRPSAYLKHTLHSSPSSSSPTTAAALPISSSPAISASPPSTSSSLSNPGPLNSIMQVMVTDQPDDDEAWADFLNLGNHSSNSTLRASQFNSQPEANARSWGSLSDDLLFPMELEQHHRSPPSIHDIFPSHFSPILSSVSPSPTFMHAMPALGPAAFSRNRVMTPERDTYPASPPSTGVSLQNRLSPFGAYDSDGYHTDPLSPLCGPEMSNLHLTDTMSPLQGYLANLSHSAPTQSMPFGDIFLSNSSLNPLATQLHSVPAFSPSPKMEPEPELDANHADDESLDSSPELDTDDADRPGRKHSRIPLPIPVPNLTKKSRGRHVPVLPHTHAAQMGVLPSPNSREEAMAASRLAAEQLASGEWRASGVKGRTYLCKICGKCFQRGEHLKRHVRSIHTHDKPHECPQPGCGKVFSRHDNLHQHMRVHRKGATHE